MGNCAVIKLNDCSSVNRKKHQHQRLTYLFERRCWVLQHLQHGPLDCSLPNVGIIFARASHACGCPSWALVPGLIEVWLTDQNEGLDGHQHLVEGEGKHLHMVMVKMPQPFFCFYQVHLRKDTVGVVEPCIKWHVWVLEKHFEIKLKWLRFFYAIYLYDE